MERLRTFNRESIIDCRLEVRPSPINGNGLFTKGPIKEGEILTVWGGILFTDQDIKQGKARPHSTVEIGEQTWLGEPMGGDDCQDEYLNHSCNPNTWMIDEVTVVAKRNIKTGEEITIDYAMFTTSNYYNFDCNCQSPLCRTLVTGDDWKSEELQERYKNHFSPYLNERIHKVST